MSEYRLEVAVLKGVGQFGPKFHGEGDVPHQPSSCRKTRDIDLSYGTGMWAEICFVFSQFTRLTDRRTDRQTAVDSKSSPLHVDAR